jgi:hypothetical protein
MIIGSANTPEEVMKYYRRLSLSKCSLNLIEIPKECSSYTFSDVFEYCVGKQQIPIAVYKRHTEDLTIVNTIQQEGKVDDGMGVRGEEKNQKKSYMWLHPPKNIELSVFDELFVLCEKNEK